MAKKKAKVSKKAKKAAARRPAPGVKAPVLGLGSPVVFNAPEGPRAAVVHGFSEQNGLNLTLFTDAGILVKMDVKGGAGEVGTWSKAGA